MQQSSPSIGTLAAALAKAQGELINPEKSLTATIRHDGSRRPDQTFRYAPLSSGLDIVRKILGQYEIATVQTTAIDQSVGIISLTTVLAHSSGEWIASDWPVCAMSETATPHRMGAALTYARRYSLFTLVGIAGEDDLDAPDLTTPTDLVPPPERPNGAGNGKLDVSPRQPTALPSRRGAQHNWQDKPILSIGVSAQLRDRLLGEIKELGSNDDAATWAHKSLADKNKLIAADAQAVEEAFQGKLESFADASEHNSKPEEANLPNLVSHKPTGQRSNKGSQKRTRAIDKSALTISEPRRVRDRDHVRAVARQPCLICGRRPADAHHLRFAQSRALARKVSDEFTVPLCRGHHREVHRCGDEAAWWTSVGIDPATAARSLWLESHPLRSEGEPRSNGHAQ